MRFRLTVFLILANAALFFFIWTLERGRTRPHASQSPILSFTTLEISGKNIDKPRVLKFENNKWRIVSPIDWKANLFAVNRIKTQLEFLDRHTCFSKSEALKAGHTLAEYGLDEPAYVIKYGGDKLNAIQIGKGTSVGNRFYLLDENSDSIVVVEREFVEALVQDMERMRDQSVFTMSRFEVASFSARMPVSKSSADKNDFKRVGLVKEAGGWKFETPIVSDADTAEVDAFLSDICQIKAVNFSLPQNGKTGFESSELPTAITLQGTTRREVLLLGGLSADGKQVYARLEGNPTVFAVSASVLDRLEGMQNALRAKNIVKFNPSAAKKIVISENGKVLTLNKVENEVWDVQVSDKTGAAKAVPANLAIVNKLLVDALPKVEARQFVSDAPGGDLSKYGITRDSLRVSIVGGGDEAVVSIALGDFYRRGGVNMRYALVGGSVYGIGVSLSSMITTDPLFYKSALVCSLGREDVVESIEIFNLRSKKSEFKAESAGGDFSKLKLGAREKNALLAVEGFVRNTVAGGYSARKFSAEGVEAESGQVLPWEFELRARYAAKGSPAPGERAWLFTKRLGASIQYCSVGGSLFLPESKLISAFFELTQERNAPAQLDVSAPEAPSKAK